MSFKSKLEKRLKEKEMEIQALEMALREARAYLQATQDALRLLSKTSEVSEPSYSVVIRPGTMLEHAFKVLKRVGKPMKAMDLLKAMGKEPTILNRQSLVGSIGAYARKGQIFMRTGLNTFGLIEWKQTEKFEKNEPPENFGSL